MAGFQPEGVARPDIQYGALDRVVSPGYFETMRIRLLRGRLFDDHDRPDAPSVAIINETMARKFWPNEDALGKRFRLNLVGGSFRLFQIVGIVDDVKEMALDEPPKEEMYFPYWQAQGNYMVPTALVIHTRGDPTSLASAVREAVWSVDPDQPVSEIVTMDGVLDQEVAQRRVQALLLGGLAALALTLACVGIYSVMAYVVTQQSHEIGIRMALGADRGKVVRLVVSGAMAQIGIGLLVGIPVALAGGRLLAHQLFGVKSYDPAVLSTAVGMLVVSALVAGLVPAMRAASIDPMEALRSE